MKIVWLGNGLTQEIQGILSEMRSYKKSTFARWMANVKPEHLHPNTTTTTPPLPQEKEKETNSFPLRLASNSPKWQNINLKVHSL
jgi:hypothetical protein